MEVAPPVGEAGGAGMWDVCIPPISSQKKKSGLHPTTLVPAFSSLHLTRPKVILT